MKKILEICKKFNADKYISGVHWGLENLNLKEFSDNQIKIEFQKFIHWYSPPYKCFNQSSSQPQIFSPFPGL